MTLLLQNSSKKRKAFRQKTKGLPWDSYFKLTQLFLQTQPSKRRQNNSLGKNEINNTSHTIYQKTKLKHPTIGKYKIQIIKDDNVIKK